ncbi:hypothetical protein B0E54_06260 [Micromonospora sp. MH99]|nr:hypothetical protein [Micromonospora sp. MH99]
MRHVHSRQPRRRPGHQVYAERVGGAADARLVGFDVGAGQAAQARRVEAGLGQHPVQQLRHLGGRYAPTRAHPGDQRRWPQHGGPPVERHHPIGDQHPVPVVVGRFVVGRAGGIAGRVVVGGVVGGGGITGRVVVGGRVVGGCPGGDDAHVRGQGGQRPGGVGDQPDRFAVQDGPGHRGDRALHRPAEAVQSGQADRVGGGGDHRSGVQQRADGFREVVAAAGMAAEQRHRVPGGLVDDHHGRVGALVPEQRREDAHHRAGGQERHHRVATRPGGPQRVGDALPLDDPRVRPGGGDGVGVSSAGGGGRDQADAGGDGQVGHGRSPVRTTTGLVAARRIDPPGRSARRAAESWLPSTV